MHASYISLLVLAASAAVPALSAPLSTRNIAVREATDVVARNASVFDSAIPPNTTTSPLAYNTSTNHSHSTTDPATGTNPNDLNLIRVLLGARSEGESTSLNGRGQTPTSPSLGDLLVLSALGSRDLNNDQVLQMLSALSRRDDDNRNGHDEELQARNFLGSILKTLFGLRDVVPGEVAARDPLGELASSLGLRDEISAQHAARNATLTPGQMLTLALLSG
ncbi:hypothetical protein BJV78DRAFT_428718 [Lactifluus subvellereus]|nr:hypothetical protein BJV78DRAFT_1158861 [Lactifluus subvellereus]KAI0251562.1 hypothetical protein BJV78DRAFT_428718 [Lactifluus subvellereus]